MRVEIVRFGNGFYGRIDDLYIGQHGRHSKLKDSIPCCTSVGEARDGVSQYIWDQENIHGTVVDSYEA
jgi:hypothetical protein